MEISAIVWILGHGNLNDLLFWLSRKFCTKLILIEEISCTVKRLKQEKISSGSKVGIDRSPAVPTPTMTACDVAASRPSGFVVCQS